VKCASDHTITRRWRQRDGVRKSYKNVVK